MPHELLPLFFSPLIFFILLFFFRPFLVHESAITKSRDEAWRLENLTARSKKKVSSFFGRGVRRIVHEAKLEAGLSLFSLSLSSKRDFCIHGNAANVFVWNRWKIRGGIKSEGLIFFFLFFLFLSSSFSFFSHLVLLYSRCKPKHPPFFCFFETKTCFPTPFFGLFIGFRLVHFCFFFSCEKRPPFVWTAPGGSASSSKVHVVIVTPFLLS